MKFFLTHLLLLASFVVNAQNETNLLNSYNYRTKGYLGVDVNGGLSSGNQKTTLQKKSNTTYISLFIAGFLGGLLALLTPCVFPMIPMTVSFFTKQSKTKAAGIRNAIIYSISIIIIYILLGLGVTLIFGADAMNNLATNVWFNLAFFVL